MADYIAVIANSNLMIKKKNCEYLLFIAGVYRD